MPAPTTHAVRVPFFYAADEAAVGAAETADTPAAPVFVTNVFIELIAFAPRFFWLHVSESPAAQGVPRLGACSVAVALQLGGDAGRTSISASQLMEFEAARQQDVSAGNNSSVQAAFAASLSRRLVHGVVKQRRAQVTVYVNCAVEGDRCLALLGTDGGSGFGMTYQFGVLVYKASLELITQHLAP